MNFDDCTFYSFSNHDGSFDFIRLSNDLHKLIKQHGMEELFVETYEEKNLPGTIQLLIELGLSKTSVIKNMQLFPNCPKHIAFEMMKELDLGMDNDNDEPEEDILYN